MKPLSAEVKKCFLKLPDYEEPHGNNGAFRFVRQGNIFRCIISDGGGWDHVSISIENRKRCPTWEEMCWVKYMFFAEDEAVVQFHPAKKDYVNNHPYCLHLWRCQKGMPTPDPSMV